MPLREATLEACRLRLRPILMTSFAFIFGVVPLVIAAGAGAEMRRSLGTAVFSGMLGVTLFGIFLTPVFYYVLGWFGGVKLAPPHVTALLGLESGARAFVRQRLLSQDGEPVELASAWLSLDLAKGTDLASADPLSETGGELPVRRPAVSEAALARWEVDPGPWRDRARAAEQYL